MSKTPRLVPAKVEGDFLSMRIANFHFYGFEPQKLIEITYLEGPTHTDRPGAPASSFQCVASEYYLVSEMEMAEKAFRERLYGAQTEHSSFARPLAEFAK